MKNNMQTVGRPASIVKIPRGKFTFLELCAANSHLAPLTIRNFMKRDRALGDQSNIVRVEDERGETGSEAGFGRKPFLYIRRELLGSNGTRTVRNVKYHVHQSKAPTHQIKGTSLPKPSEPHAHKILDVPTKVNQTATSITISFAPMAHGAPVPTSVTVNFLPKTLGVPQVAPEADKKEEKAPEVVVPPVVNPTPAPPITPVVPPTPEKAPEVVTTPTTAQTTPIKPEEVVPAPPFRKKPQQPKKSTPPTSTKESESTPQAVAPVAKTD